MALLLALATAAALAEHAAGQMLSMPATRCPAAGMQQAALDAVTRTCCAAPARCPNSGMPSACSQACSDVFTPLYSACGRELDDNMPGLRVFATLCPVPSLGHGGKVCGFGANAPCPAGSRTDRSTAAVIAAFTADAASMPFHWIYSGAQITRTVGRGNHPEFYASPQVQWYHYRTGALSPFGEQGMVYLRTLTSSTNQASSFVDPVEIAAAYNVSAHSSPQLPLAHLRLRDCLCLQSYYSGSGTCASSDNCYHDTCTRGFVANMAAGRSWPECGANDDQDEAITHLIPVVALLAGRPEMLARAKDAVRVIQSEYKSTPPIHNLITDASDCKLNVRKTPIARRPSASPRRGCSSRSCWTRRRAAPSPIQRPRCATAIASSRHRSTRSSRPGSSGRSPPRTQWIQPPRRGSSATAAISLSRSSSRLTCSRGSPTCAAAPYYPHNSWLFHRKRRRNVRNLPLMSSILH